MARTTTATSGRGSCGDRGFIALPRVAGVVVGVAHQAGSPVRQRLSRVLQLATAKRRTKRSAKCRTKRSAKPDGRAARRSSWPTGPVVEVVVLVEDVDPARREVRGPRRVLALTRRRGRQPRQV